MNRRHFIRTTALVTTAAAVTSCETTASRSGAKSWPIGCFNRPWTGDKKNWGYEVALAGIQEAGFHVTGLLTRGPKEPLAGSDATQEYLQKLKAQIAAHGLVANMAALRPKNELPIGAQIKDMRQQIDNARFIGVEYLLTFGVDKPEQYENYYALMRDAAPYAAERKLKLVLKPHGGASGASEEILRSMAKVGHPNYKVWFDAGNIIFYTGKDPLEQLKPIIGHVTGFCAKDCDKQGGTVWLEFGTGKVDFRSVFAALNQAGFNGPVMVECCAPSDTPEAITVNARKNREYLENLFATI